MPFPLPTLEQIRTAILNDWRNQNDKVKVDTDSDNYIRASGIASAITGLYQFASWGINQYFPDTADAENLVRFAAARGLAQKPAASATGTILLTGAAGAVIPLATIVQTGDGLQYETTASAMVRADGTASAPAIAVIPGPTGNQPDNTPGVLQAAPAGVDPAVILSQMRGGTEAEPLASLLARVLEDLRRPPAGGNESDYKRWALEVPGVTTAFVYPNRRGIGSADVAILSNGQPPSDALRAAVSAYIDERKPVECDCMVVSPELMVVDVGATVVLSSDADLVAVRAKVLTGLTAYFAALRPGDPIRRSRVQTIIGDVDGVVDFDLITPVANVVTLTNANAVQMAVLGTVSIEV